MKRINTTMLNAKNKINCKLYLTIYETKFNKHASIDRLTKASWIVFFFSIICKQFTSVYVFSKHITGSFQGFQICYCI